MIPPTATEQTYYGKEYWFSHQEQDLGLPNILSRARSDLADRIPYWLEKVLCHCRPPGRALELGCSHGGFVAALRQSGFDAAGLEISPWVVDFARQAFNIPMFLGPIEQQTIQDGMYDLVAIMDVVEHLLDPLTTLRRVARTLRPNGIVVIQTPEYPQGKSLDELKASDSPFLRMLIPNEHIYLFSRQSLQKMLNSIGLTYCYYESPLFPYDQFVFASTQPVPIYTANEIALSLQQGENRRFVLALIDLFEDLRRYEQQYQQADRDRNARMDQINELEHLLQESEADRAARLDRMSKLELQLQESEADRAARLDRMNELADKIRTMEKEHSSLLNQAFETQKEFAQLQQTIFYRVMGSLGGVKPFETALAGMPHVQAPRRLQRIAVDLTPIRPGGENGGAKPLALELIKRLSREIAPDIEYILLTSSDTHEELSWLDNTNVKRMCMNQVGNAAEQSQASAAPSGNPTQKRPLWRRFTRRIGRTLEIRIPIGTYRKIYRLYHRQVNSPKINNLVRSLNVDLVFCPFTAVYYYAPEIPVAVIVHDLQHLYYPQFFSPEQNYHTSRNLLQVCKLATRIICVSEYTRQTVLKVGEVDPDRVVTIPSTIFTSLSAQPEGKIVATLEEFHLTAGEYLFFPANFWRHKNHAMLLTAFSLYCQKHPESRLRLVFSGTPGPRMQFLQEAAARMMLAERVVFAGYVEPEKLAALFQGCLAVIFPSLFEGFGAPVLEGMYFRKPVLCSNLTSLPEIGGEAVLYFDPRRPEEIVQAVERIVNEPDLVKNLALKGQKQASRFATPNDWARQYLAVFDGTFHAGQVLQNALIGMFPDRWVGSNLEISISADAEARQLELQLNVPLWFPNKKVTIQFQGPVLQQAKTFVLERGQSHKLSLPLLPQGGVIHGLIDATISPKEAGINDDTRQVSFTLLSCQINAEDHSIELA